MLNKKSILTLIALFTAGFVPIQLVTLSFAYSQYYKGESLGPKMVITAHDFAVPYIYFVYIPSIIVFIGIWIYSKKNYPDLFRRLKVGVISGIMLTLALDVVRQNGVINGWLPQDVPMQFGKMVTGSNSFNSIFIAGLLVHFLNGINFGILYTFFFGKLKNYKTAMLAGTLLLFAIEIGMMVGPPMAKMVGPFGVNWAWPQLFLLTLTAHIFSGIACGLTAQFLLKEEDNKWLIPFLLNKNLNR
ncbi:MAG: hypothetical protein H8E60_10975 [Candidatus Marinimicrobia bacterium]|nr:hypothetical protein [Candidatus Neomarinimicrobiota bacterium]